MLSFEGINSFKGKGSRKIREGKEILGKITSFVLSINTYINEVLCHLLIC